MHRRCGWVNNSANRRETVSETFPTKVLPAADGSKEAQQAPSTAADLTKSTGSELHVVHVGPFCPCLLPLWRKRRRGWRGRLVGRWTTRYSVSRLPVGGSRRRTYRREVRPKISSPWPRTCVLGWW